MFRRVLGFIGAITFIIGGINVLSKGCGDVDFGGTARNASYSCVPEGKGEVSGPLGGWGMIALGLLLIVFVCWPFINTLLEERRSRW